MKKTIKVPLLAALMALALVLAAQPKAGAVLVGLTPGGPHEAIQVNADAVAAAGFTDSWTVGSEQAPISLDYLATNGLWLAQLAGSHPYTTGQMIQLHEWLVIGPNSPSWVNWNQKFVTEGFNFLSGTFKVNGNVVANGITTPPNFNGIDFNFAALPAGTVVEITKNIQWMGTAGGDFQNVFQGAPNLIQLEQYPTVVGINPVDTFVPEPASLALIALGLSMSGMIKKFRKRNATSQA